MQTLVQSTSIMPSDTLFLHIYKGNISNTFVYYEDDGKTFDYQKGKFYKRNIVYDPIPNTLVLDKVQGDLPSKFKTILLVLHGFIDSDTLMVNDKIVPCQYTAVSFLSPTSVFSFDDSRSTNSVDQCKVIITAIKNDSNRITIGF
ncbi:MAG: DUF5110 domain-containing protein [Ferruginibacter sp.]